MTSLFRDCFALAAEVIDTVYGEEFEVTPMRAVAHDVNARHGVDTSRPIFRFFGSFVSVDAEYHAEGRRMPADATRASVAPSPTIDVAEGTLPHPVRKGDRLRRIDTGEFFDVGQPKHDDVGRLALPLIERQARAAL
ncbi:hypothetical protein [Hansschlegelia zhihuaiae]|uniref:Uncharacterized protein n=1 Tax=Hansschlegelia zhihuaiae TaxID=405005 RepID=A0A4Q0M430_9HYPH|nr:hypothetical protein [Hansschlegelia zhihuaiae]RXF67690.1 hypothetical protein EK403_21035 [Hansschlegelia zhihuaiae]